MGIRKLTLFGLCLLSLVVVSCADNNETGFQFEYDFEENEGGWVTGFADLPADYDPAIYELDSGRGELPPGLEWKNS